MKFASLLLPLTAISGLSQAGVLPRYGAIIVDPNCAATLKAHNLYVPDGNKLYKNSTYVNLAAEFAKWQASGVIPQLYIWNSQPWRRRDLEIVGDVEKRGTGQCHTGCKATIPYADMYYVCDYLCG